MCDRSMEANLLTLRSLVFWVAATTMAFSWPLCSSPSTCMHVQVSYMRIFRTVNTINFVIIHYSKWGRSAIRHVT